MIKEQQTQTPKTEQEILKELEGFIGSVTFLKDSMPFRNSLLTEGFQYFLKVCECEWLYSDIAVYIKMKLLNKEHLLYTQKYDYTDFPLKEYEFYAVFNGEGYTFMLKREY